MTIRKYNNQMNDLMPQPFSAMLDRLFTDTVNNRSKLSGFTPNTDVAETDQGFEFEIALPGYKKEAINIDFQEGRLTVSGERILADDKKEKNFHLLETQYGKFSRSFMLPENIEAEAIEATFENGMLHIAVPKAEKKEKKHQIEIR